MKEFTLENLKVKETFNPKHKKGTLHLCLAGGAVISADDKKIGELKATVGGGIQISIDSVVYYIDPLDIFNAVYAVHEKRRDI
jgi:hypothetical protein